MNDLTRYQPQNTPLSSFNGGHPLDVLWDISPEIASIAYAHREGLLSPEILPAIVGFRECHAQEKIATLRAIVDRLAIDADERKTHIIAQTRERIGQLEYEAGITRASMASDAQIQSTVIHETANVRREQLRSNTALEVQKLKYETNRYAIEQNEQTQRYLSDNQVRALHTEAVALRDIIVFIETNRNALRAKELDAQMKAKAMAAQMQYLTKLAEAESYRTVQQHHDRASVTREYLRTQAIINRSAIEFEIAKTEASALSEQASYRALTDIAKEAFRRGAKRVRFSGQTRFGEINFDIEMDHGQ